MRRVRLLIAGTGAILLAMSGCDWSQFRHLADHSAHTHDRGINAANITSVAFDWSATTGDAVRSSAAIVAGLAYVGSDDGTLYAFDAEDGTTRWTATTGAAVDSSPAVADGKVYVGSDDSALYAFDAADGTPLWTATTGGAINSSPAVVNTSLVFVGSGDGTLYAFDAEGVTNCSAPPVTCAPRWTATTGGAIDSSPAVAEGEVYVGSGDGKLYAYTTPTKLFVMLSADSSGTGSSGPVARYGVTGPANAPTLETTIDDPSFDLPG